MESRGDSLNEKPKSRPAISRRSCDQCRARKVACDRASPCSNCLSSRLDCTHSSVSTSVTPKQRVLISAQYERKIDDIAKGVDGIKLLLQGLNVSTDTNTNQPRSSSIPKYSHTDSAGTVTENRPISVSSAEPQWDHSPLIIDFVKAVVDDGTSRGVQPENNQILSSLKSLVHSLDNPSSAQNLPLPAANAANSSPHLSMPPLEAAVAILRWAKDHEFYTRITMFANILPLERFADICRKVYFAVDDYSQIDFILANGYLSCIFGEHGIATGSKVYDEYYLCCRENLHSTLLRLPLLLPPSMETIGALTLGAFNSIENSKATLAWTFISTAADFCQRLGYHRVRSSTEADESLRAAQERLFWTVHRLEKGLSLRFGRASNIRDAEITLPIGPDSPRARRLSRLQGNAHDQLYSPRGLSQPADQRKLLAKTLAEELRGLINETHVEISNVTEQVSREPLRLLYLQCDLVCQSSLLSLILRATDSGSTSMDGVTEEYVEVARETLDMHHRCMTALGNCGSPLMVTQYMNWAILQIPFVSFSILFTRTIQLLDLIELARLENFSASLQPDASSSSSPESTTHPSRLYKLLCQAARMYITSNIQTPPGTEASTLVQHLPTDVFEGFSFVNFGEGANGDPAASDPSPYGLSDWYYGNQQLMQLLDEDMMF